MAQAGLGKRPRLQGSLKAGRRGLSRILSSQSGPEAAPCGQQSWLGQEGMWWGVCLHPPQPLATSVPSCQLHKLPPVAELPAPQGGFSLRGVSPSQDCQPCEVPGSWVAENSGSCSTQLDQKSCSAPNF